MRQGIEQILSPQTAATTFAFFPVFYAHTSDENISRATVPYKQTL